MTQPLRWLAAFLLAGSLGLPAMSSAECRTVERCPLGEVCRTERICDWPTIDPPRRPPLDIHIPEIPGPKCERVQVCDELGRCQTLRICR